MPVTFLTAEWRHLLMVNYEAAPALLAPYVPDGVELDLYEGKTLVSLVGFRFLRTRLLGLAPIPFHIDFDELNLRFYVVRRMPSGEIRRGVCFIREFVPRAAIAFVARALYREPYVAVPMWRHLELTGPAPYVAYGIRHGAAWHLLTGRPTGHWLPASSDPGAEFITEHYWGYTRRGPGVTDEYQVKHPVWNIQPVTDARFDGDAGRVYGFAWAEVLAQTPHSAFLADGSPIAVMGGARMTRG